MSNYSRGKIYTIRCRTDDTLIYVGSTIESRLSARFCKHKSQPHCSLSQFINNPENNTSWDNWYIELHEEFPCEHKMQLIKRENEIIREIATINKIGYRTEEMKKEQEKNYRATNKEKISLRSKEYREDNKEHINEVKALYRSSNRQKLNEQEKERYQMKKEEISIKNSEFRAKNNEKVTCECGSCVVKYRLNEHLKTTKHIEFMSKKE